MKKVLILTCVLCITLVLGCGKGSNENVSVKQVKQNAGIEKDAGKSKERLSVKVNNLKQERNLEMEEAKPISVSDENFESEVIQSDIPVLVDFWAPWCGPCHMAAPVLEKIAKQYKGSLKVCKLNVDEGRQTAMKYGIMSIPTLNLYVNGEVVDQIIGVTPSYESDLKRKIEPHI